MSEEPLNAHRITLSLFSWLRDSSDLIIPRFTPAGWWECDVWRLRDSGFTDEFEIKMSVGDFRADSAKSRSRWMPGAMNLTDQQNENKHEMIAAGRGPNRFWFVTTEEIASKVEIPDFAGMVVVNRLGRSAGSKKTAPKIHSNKWTGRREKVLEAFYHRYWNHQFDGKPAIPFESVFDIDAEEPRETQPILPLA